MTFGQRLIEFRKVGKISQNDLAQLLNCSQANISRYEKDEFYPSNNALDILQKTYGLNLNWLISGEGTMFLPKNYPTWAEMGILDSFSTLKETDSMDDIPFVDDIRAKIILEESTPLMEKIMKRAEDSKSTDKCLSALPSMEPQHKIRAKIIRKTSPDMLQYSPLVAYEETDILRDSGKKSLHTEFWQIPVWTAESSPKQIDLISVSKDIVINPNEYLCYKIDDDSMLPEIKSGDYALIHKTSQIKELDDRIVAIKQNNDIFLRKVSLNTSDNSCILTPFNQKYKPVIYTKEFCILGYLKLVIRQYNV
jgi:transcriptional regulator with XRE-family HTH domain